MRGYAATVRPTASAGRFQELVDLLAEGGYTSVVATDSDGRSSFDAADVPPTGGAR